MRIVLALALCACPALAFAAGDEDDLKPPEPTETTETCEEGLIWDEKSETCMAPEETSNEEASLRRTARELAYVGRYTDAQRVLDLLPSADPWVLTYRGFLARKTGDADAANQFYMAVIAMDPNNLLARSYMAQGFVETGAYEAARLQLSEIQARGGRGTWPELALRKALSMGVGSNY